MRQVRVFVSSPSDARFERQRLTRIIERLNGELAGIARLDAIRWEDEVYQAHTGFQPQIPEARECDVVIAIFRARLGLALPASFGEMATGEPYPSGTAYEVLTAIAAKQAQGLPDVYVFRHAEPPSVRLDDPQRAEIESQWQRLKAFFDRWFQTPQGEFKAAFQTFRATDEFEAQAEQALRQWIAEHVHEGRRVSWPIAEKGSPFRGLDAFGHRHAPVFFGRDRDTGRAVDALKDAAEAGTPFLLITGPSGAGKSSLARAGLVPRLTAPGVVPEVDVWRVAVVRPGDGLSDPMAALSARLFDGVDDLPLEDEGRPPALPELAQGDYRTPQALADLFEMGQPAAALPVIAALDRIGAEAGCATASTGRCAPISCSSSTSWTICSPPRLPGRPAAASPRSCASSPGRSASGSWRPCATSSLPRSTPSTICSP